MFRRAVWGDVESLRYKDKAPIRIEGLLIRAHKIAYTYCYYSDGVATHIISTHPAA